MAGGRDRVSNSRHRDFRVFWAGLAVSDLGSAITYLALPLTAIGVLGAGAREMGWLVALQQLPVPLFGLFAGVWVDRLRRRPLIVCGEFGIASLLLTIPLCAWLDLLTLAQLYAVAFGTGTLKLLLDLGTTTYLPTLVAREQLLAANARLQVIHQVAATAGRSAGGALIALLTPPIAILLDALSSFFTAGTMASLRASEPERDRTAREGFWREILDGARTTFRIPEVAAMTLSSTLGSFGGAVQQAVLFLFFVRELELGPFWIGAVTAAAAVAALCGAAVAPRAGARFGPGPAIVSASLLWTIGMALVPASGLGLLPALPVLFAAQLCAGFASTLFSVNQISLRQALTPDALLGRVNATRRVLVFGAIPVGALLGGALGEWLGLLGALGVGAVLNALATVYAFGSPLRRARLPAGEPMGTRAAS